MKLIGLFFGVAVVVVAIGVFLASSCLGSVWLTKTSNGFGVSEEPYCPLSSWYEYGCGWMNTTQVCTPEGIK